MKSFQKVMQIATSISLVLLLSACGKTDLRIKLSEGDSRVVEVVQEYSDPKNPEKTNRKVTQYRFDVERVDPEGNHFMKVTIEKGGLGDIEGLSALGGMLPDLGSLSLDGKTFQMVLGARGTVTGVQGMNAQARELADKIVESLKKGVAESQDVPPILKGQLAAAMGQVETLVRKMVSQQLGDAAMRDDLAVTFSMYTDQPVKKGMEWTKTYSTEAPMAMNVTEKWRFEGKENDLLKLTFVSDVTSNPNAPGIEFMGMKMTTNVTGKVSGTAFLERATGWPKTITSDVDLNVTVGILGMTMPKTMKGTQRWDTKS